MSLAITAVIAVALIALAFIGRDVALRAMAERAAARRGSAAEDAREQVAQLAPAVADLSSRVLKLERAHAARQR